MKKSRRKEENRRWTLGLVFVICFFLIYGGYGLYQVSIERAVYSTTVSFMEQIADHDHLNILNQMNIKWEYLSFILQRVKTSRNPQLETVIYDLGIEAKSTSFEDIYLIADGNRVYSNTYMEASLKDMPWGETYRQAANKFVTLYNESSREKWGEYLVYGIRLEEPIRCGEMEFTGIVGLVPVSEIAEQMRLESFDGQGSAIVMQPTGEIITSSRNYSSLSASNYLADLENARFKKGGSLQQCRQAIENRESLFMEYSLNGEDFYVLFQPMNREESSDWYVVVRVSTGVTQSQALLLVRRSLLFFVVLGIIVFGMTYFIYKNINEGRIAKASEQTKSAFLANMSHEIRTPLNGIIGLHYLMRRSLDDREKMEEYLTKAEVSAEFLKGIITDVLDMSKIESGQFEIYNSMLNLPKLVEDIRDLMENLVREKGLRLSMEYDKLSYPYVMGDELRVKQVLTNLLGNALKFTPQGGKITLLVRQEPGPEQKTVKTTFIVADTGAGMSPEFLERIWLPFEQERRITSQNGTGLGTTLSKTLVEKMGGSIEVESSLGEGTTFTVCIPFTVEQEPERTETISAGREEIWDLKGKRILVAEDNEINRLIVVSILKEKGCELTEAENGEEAVFLFEESPVGYYDLILMDVRMPVMDGYEACRKIRSMERPDADKMPIFAVTANAFGEDADKALEAGMDDVVTKPLDIGLLLEKINNLQRKQEVYGNRD